MFIAVELTLAKPTWLKSFHMVTDTFHVWMCQDTWTLDCDCSKSHPSIPLNIDFYQLLNDLELPHPHIAWRRSSFGDLPFFGWNKLGLDKRCFLKVPRRISQIEEAAVNIEARFSPLSDCCFQIYFQTTAKHTSETEILRVSCWWSWQMQLQNFAPAGTNERPEQEFFCSNFSRVKTLDGDYVFRQKCTCNMDQQ